MGNESGSGDRTGKGCGLRDTPWLEARLDCGDLILRAWRFLGLPRRLFCCFAPLFSLSLSLFPLRPLCTSVPLVPTIPSGLPISLPVQPLYPLPSVRPLRPIRPLPPMIFKALTRFYRSLTRQYLSILRLLQLLQGFWLD